MVGWSGMLACVLCAHVRSVVLEYSGENECHRSRGFRSHRVTPRGSPRPERSIQPCDEGRAPSSLDSHGTEVRPLPLRTRLRASLFPPRPSSHASLYRPFSMFGLSTTEYGHVAKLITKPPAVYLAVYPLCIQTGCGFTCILCVQTPPGVYFPPRALMLRYI